MDLTIIQGKVKNINETLGGVEKYKLMDLENFSMLQRKCLFYSASDLIPSAKEDISFFNASLAEYNNSLTSGATLDQGYDALIDICKALKKLSQLYLFDSQQMIQFCFEFEKFFDFLKKKKDITKLIELFYEVIKMLRYFIYCYNDNMLYKAITSSKKVEFSFIFSKNELGRQISRNTIKILFFCISECKGTVSESSKKYHKIIRHGIKIMSYLISSDDSFILSTEKAIIVGPDYYQIIHIKQDDPTFEKLEKETFIISDLYVKYHESQIDISSLILNVTTSLTTVINMSLRKEIQNYILKTKYFSCVTKIFDLISFENEKDEDTNDKLIKAYFEFIYYFVNKNSSFALLMISHYVLKSILKLPQRFSKKVLEFCFYCADLICENDKSISFSKHIIKSLFEYLLTLNEKDETQDTKTINNTLIIESAESDIENIDEESISGINLKIKLFLKILIKLTIETKQLDKNFSCKVVKKIMIKFLNHFSFTMIVNDNKYLVLYIANYVFDFLSLSDRKVVLSLIPLEELIEKLNDIKINLRFRIEILKFLKKYKFSIYFSHAEQKNQNKNNDKTSRRHQSSRHSTHKFSKQASLPQGLYPGNKVNLSLDVKLNSDYLSFFKENQDVFEKIIDNPLISNYQFPTKYFSFNYDFIRMMHSDDKNETELAEEDLESLSLLQKELKSIQEIYRTNTHNISLFLDYLSSGVFSPLTLVIKKIFCYMFKGSGEIILTLYSTIYDVLLILGYLFEQGEDFVSAARTFESNYFTFNFFLSLENKKELKKDLIELGDVENFSPFDYTRTYRFFEKYLFSFLLYPKSLQLWEKAGAEIKPIKKDVQYAEITLNTITNNCETSNPTEPTHRRGNRLKTPGHQENINIINEMSKLKKDVGFKKKHDLSNEDVIKRLLYAFGFYAYNKSTINESTSSLFVSLRELSIEFEQNFRKMLISIISYLLEEKEEYELECLLLFYKLLSIETTKTQKDIVEYLKNSISSNFLANFANLLYQRTIKLFIQDFCEDREGFEKNEIFCFNIVKIIKLLCDGSNNFFQEKILTKLEYRYNNLGKSTEDYAINRIRDSILGPSDEFSIMSFWNFSINVLIKIFLLNNKCKDEPHTEFLFDLFDCIIEMLIKIIQGNKEQIYCIKDKKTKRELTINKDTLDTFKVFSQIASEIIFDESINKKYSFKIRLQLIVFFVSVIEEKDNEEIQKIIIKFMPVSRVLNSIISILKTYFYNHTKDSPSYALYYSNYDEKQIIELEFVLDYTLYKFFEKEYYTTDFSKNSEEFSLANHYYKYIKLLSIGNKSKEASNLIKRVDEINLNDAKKNFSLFNKKLMRTSEVAPINLISDQEKVINLEFVEQFYTIKFFEMITGIVEVRLEQKRNQLVIFTIPNEMIYLSKMTKVEFSKNVDRTSETTKKRDLLNNIPLFEKEIKYFKKRKPNKISKFIVEMNYIYLQIFVYIYAVAFNCFMLATLHGYKEIESIDTDSRRLRNLLEIPSKITDAIDDSIQDWGEIYDAIAYVYVVLNGLLIVLWIVIKMPLYYKLDRLKYIQENKITKSQLTWKNKLYISIVETIFYRDYINTLIYMFLLSLVGAIMKRGEIIYAFFLLAIINLNNTLKNIVVSVQQRLTELGASGLLLIALVYFYTNIGYFFFNDDYKNIIEDPVNEDNYCQSIAFCFLTNIDAGIRARGGAADQMIRISFERNMVHYVKRIFFDVSYFLICIIIMIDLVFGIINEAFGKKISEEAHYEDDRKKHCFICHVTREMTEKKGEDFVAHREEKHNLWTYVNYMIFLRLSKIHELNSVNTYARQNLDKKNKCFLPTFHDSYDDEEEEEEKAEEKEIISPEEEEEESEESEEVDDMEAEGEYQDIE